jgi:hypothetical protein
MTQPLGSLDPLLSEVVLVTLAIGLPIIMVLAIRFLWYRDLNIGRSKELEKLIWQLHRIATALEHDKGLSFPAEQPVTEYPAARVPAQEPVIAVHNVPQPSAAQPSIPQPSTQKVGPEEPRHAGVNSMFGF